MVRRYHGLPPWQHLPVYGLLHLWYETSSRIIVSSLMIAIGGTFFTLGATLQPYFASAAAYGGGDFYTGMASPGFYATLGKLRFSHIQSLQKALYLRLSQHISLRASPRCT